jgi:hypothetical protein
MPSARQQNCTIIEGVFYAWSVPKFYRGHQNLFVNNRNWEAVSQGHEAVMEKSWEYKDENGSSPWWIVKISWVQIRTEEYKVFEDKKIS